MTVAVRTLLRNPDVQRDVKRYREVVEKVTLYQTLGIDVSELFSDMVLVRAIQRLALHTCLTPYQLAPGLCDPRLGAEEARLPLPQLLCAVQQRPDSTYNQHVAKGLSR